MQTKYLCLALVFALVLVQIQADNQVLNNRISENKDNDNESEERVDEDDGPKESNRALDFEPMKPDEVKTRGLKCVPGRTTVTMRKIEEDDNEAQRPNGDGDGDDGGDDDARRTHMNWKGNKTNELCQICTCSQEGKDEFCSGRPARNVNECLVLARLTEELQNNIPFDHERELKDRIRRKQPRRSDLLWHNDELPYESNAKCRRGFSYYSNSITANDTDIDVPTEIDSLLDYNNPGICFYCVCATDATSVGCVPRDPWFCEYYRTIRHQDAMRVDYAKEYQQDRPAYFKTLSFRLRRTMDWGLIDVIDIGGDSLCCSHSDGHRRSLHNSVRAKLRQLRRRMPKENLMERPGVDTRGDYDDFIVNNDKKK